MNDGMDYVPELSRPPGHGNLRDQLNNALRELAQEREARAQAEAGAVQMARYIEERIDSRVWSHDDVIRMIGAMIGALVESPLVIMAGAKTKGIPPTYTVFVDIVLRRAQDVREEFEKALAAGELDPKRLASEDMRQDLIDRLPKPKDVA